MKFIGVVCAVGLFISGCMSSYTRVERYHHDSDSSLARPSMSLNDVIDLSKSGVSDSIIIDEIRVTHSYFPLSSSDIITLKNSGVSENVIDEMIASTASSSNTSSSSHPREYYYDGLYPYYWGPPLGLTFGYRYYRPFYGFYHAPHYGFRGVYRGFGGRR